MLLEWMYDNLFVTLGLWTAIYISDYALTLLGASWRKRYAPLAEIQGSYELNRYYVSDINQQRKISIRFIVALAWTLFLLAMSWLLARTGTETRFLFEIVLGALFLSEITIHMRHLRNLVTFRRKPDANEIQGKVAYARRYVFWLSAVDLFLFALLWLLLFLFTGAFWFIGGALACGALGLRHRRQMKREPLLTSPEPTSNTNINPPQA